MIKSELKPGSLIDNRYNILSVVGSGWLGSVYRAADVTRDGKIIALKMVGLNRPANDIPEIVERFQREFQILTQLRHPNLVSVYDYSVTSQGELYLTTEWIQGRKLDPGRPLMSLAAAIPIVIQICRALAYLHSRGVIHGDLKPSHVMITDSAAGEPHVKIVDFGVALEMNTAEVRTKYYTPDYSAPEVIKHRSVDHRADLYSLGAMWYAMLVGASPVFTLDPGRDRLITFMLHEALANQGQTSAGITAVINRLLAAAPANRYSSADQVIAAINEAMNSTYALETPETARSYALRAQFIDRQNELAVLRAAWQEACTNETRLVFVSGENGIGKTRLLEEFEIQAEMEGARVVWGQCVESGGSAYHPWREVLRVLTRYVENIAGAGQVLARVGPVLADILPDLWERDYMQGMKPPAELAPLEFQQRLNNAITQVLHIAASFTPIVIAVEDAHWADEATLALISYFARIPGQAGLFICITYDSDKVGAEHPLITLTGDRIRTIKVGNLSPKLAADLVCSMLGMEHLPTPLATRLQQSIGGNALFIRELVRSLAEDGVVLQRTVEGWQVDFAALETIQIPESIRQLVLQRLTQLSTLAQQALVWASAVGEVFWEGCVAEVGQVAHPTVRMALNELINHELVMVRQESAFANQREYIFIASAMREVSYEGISPERRQDYHARIAAWLIENSRQEFGEHLGLIANHLEKAGQIRDAISYLYLAGQQAAKQFANTEAIAYFNRAIHLSNERGVLEKASLSQAQLIQHSDLLLAREQVYHLQGERTFQYQDLSALNEIASQLGEQQQAKIALRQALYAEATSNYQEAIRAAQEAIHLAHLAQDVHIEAAGHLQWAQDLWRLADFEACRFQLEKSLELARQAGIGQLEADSLRILGNVWYYLGNYAQATVYWEQSLPISRSIGERTGEASALSNLGEAARSQGDYVGAKAYYEQRLRICRETGEQYGESIALINMSLVLHNLGDNQAAYQYGQQALNIAQKIANRMQQGYVWTNLGHAQTGLSHWAEAAEAYYHAAQLRRELGEHHLAMEPIAGLARVHLAQGQISKARACVEEILCYLENSTLDGTEEPLKVYATCYHILRDMQDPRSQTILETAHRLLEERAARISNQDLRNSFLENVPENREIVAAWEAKG